MFSIPVWHTRDARRTGPWRARNSEAVSSACGGEAFEAGEAGGDAGGGPARNHPVPSHASHSRQGLLSEEQTCWLGDPAESPQEGSHPSPASWEG